MKFLSLIAVGAMLAVAGYFLFNAPEKGRGWTVSNLNGEAGETSRITDFRMQEKLGKDDFWTLNAREVSVNGNRTDMSDVKMHLAKPMKNQQMTGFDLTSQKARMDNKTKDVLFYGNVLFQMPHPLTLSTDKLEWNSSRREVTTEEPVNLESSKAVMTGKGLTVNLDEQTVSVHSHVQAVYR